MEIKIDATALEKRAAQLQRIGKDAKKVVTRALNRTIDSTYTAADKAIRKKYNIKSGDVKAAMKKKKASAGNCAASISASGKVLSMAHFSYTPKQPSYLKARVKRTAGRISAVKMPQTKVKIKKGRFTPVSKKAFVAQAKGAMNVFKRERKARLPIAPLRTISIPQMLSSKDIKEQVETKAKETLEKRLDHEIQREMDKIK